MLQDLRLQGNLLWRQLTRANQEIETLHFGPLAVVFFLILKFFGKEGNPWTDLGWLPWMPAALGAGLGLGWGRLRDSAGNE